MRIWKSLLVVAGSSLFGQSASLAAERSSTEPAATTLDKVEVQGESISDLRARRDFVAGKLLISRKSIEESGQTTVYEVLKREPAVTVGADGRLGLMGLPGYTQLLVDGKPPLPGRSPLDQDVVHIERIEIVKGSLAEFGPFGIAGTINIVTRRSEWKKSASIRLGTSLGPSLGDGNVAWSNSIRPVDEPWSLNNRVSLRRKESDVLQRSETSRPTSAGAPLAIVDQASSDIDDRQTQFTLSSTYSYAWSKQVDVDLSPIVLLWRSDTDGAEHHDWRPSPSSASLPPDALIATRGKLLSVALPLSWQYRQEDGGSMRFEWESSRTSLDRDNQRRDGVLGENPGVLAQQQLFRQIKREERSSLDKLRIDVSPHLADDHAVKFGASVGLQRARNVERGRLDGQPDPAFAPFGDTQRLRGPTWTAFLQDEWTLTPQWAATAGVSVEHRRLRIDEGPFHDRASYRVLSPSLHVAHKLDAAGARKLRVSISRSFNAPSSDQYLRRPTLNPLASCLPNAGCGANSIEYADTAGNPALKPERALGITVSYEHYFAKDSMFSVDGFSRRLSDVIGEAVALESVPWAQVPRYVIRPDNLGTASVHGLSAETRLALVDLDATWPKVELRAGATLARSELRTVPGPDNRIAGQMPWSAKVGARYKLKSMPLELSMDANWAPGLWYRSAVDRRLFQGRREDLSAQAAWTISPTMKLRFSASNLLSSDQRRQDVFGAGDEVAARVSTRKFQDASVGLTVELKL